MAKLQLAPLNPGEAERLCTSPEYEPFVLYVGTNWTLYLNRRDQRYLGRAYLWQTNRHVDMHPFDDLTLEEYTEMFELIRKYRAVLARLWAANMVNSAWLGNETHIHRGHGHLHLIPRYGRPPTFDGQEFPDLRFGQNYAPYEKLELPDERFFKLRDLLREHLGYST